MTKTIVSGFLHGAVLRLALLSSLVLAVAACSVKRDVELPSNSSTGSDEMKSSPCACERLDFNSGGFEWLS
ncbi:hypothetical protein [Ferrovibrio sp.]|uniref:hypothetical protein n=1 Tax=Ferrovibrio sp. TaxID=1917215 RepID=UPI00311EA73A